jgi:uncharacterized protein YcgI (DUF1989 family)
MIYEIPPRSGVAFELSKGDMLKVIDPEGEQVADIYAFNKEDLKETLSSGRSIDYNESINFGTGSLLYSNKSNVMFKIIEDTVGVHDFLLTPCSVDTFKHFYPDEPPVPGCHGNLFNSFKKYGITEDQIGTTFNTFMNVELDKNGGVKVLPPVSKAGDHMIIVAEMDLIVGLTACSAGESNNFKYKSVHYELLRGE